MTAALLLVGAAFLLVGYAFFWLNLNTPYQTRIPAFTLPVGAVAVLLGLGRLIA